MESLVDIALVMLVAGVLGGLVNYFLSDLDQEKRLPWGQHVVVGVVASFMVPLFLNMISGDLIDKIRGTDKIPADPSKLFVLAGFCLVAAVSSRAFIRTLSERVLQEVKKKVEAVDRKADAASDTADSAKAQASAAAADATEAIQAVSPLVEDEGFEAPAAVERVQLEQEQLASIVLSTVETRILESMHRSTYSLRSMTGIANEVGLPRAEVDAALASLVAKGLLGETTGKSGQARWFLTTSGRTFKSE